MPAFPTNDNYPPGTFPVNASYDALLATTIEKYANKTLTDNVFTARPLTWYLTQKNRINFLDGGAKILEPIVFAGATTAGSYAGADTIALSDDQPFTNAEYDWKQFAASVSISGIDEAKNAGEAAIINLLEAKMMNTEETIKEAMNQMFFADGTGNSGKDWIGLEAIISSGDVLGGIDGNDQAWWNSTVDSTAGALTLSQMTSLYNTVSKGNDKPDFVMTTQTLFEKYESLLQPQLRYSDTKTAEAGFENLMFKSCPVMFDAHCPSGIAYFLNSKYLQVIGHRNVWFKNRGWIMPQDADVRYLLLLSYGNMTCRNRARQGKLTNKTA